VLKNQDACKQAVDAYFDALRNIDNMNVDQGAKVDLKAKLTKKVAETPSWRNRMSELVINSYISALGTPVVNLLSTIAKAPFLITERALLGLMPGNKVKLGETTAMMRGFFDGIADGIGFFQQGWKEGMPLDSTVVDTTMGFGRSVTSGPIEKAVSPVVTAPTKASVAIDEFSKAIFRRMQLNAKAYRIAESLPENTLGGLTRDEMYTKLRTVDISDPTKIGNERVWQQELKKLSPDLVDELINFSKIQTFQQELGEIGNMMLRAKAKLPELVFIAPFIKTPINILKDALSYTGAGLFMKSFKGRRDEAAARLLIGAGLTGMVAKSVIDQNLTGSYPKDPGRREAMIAAKIPEYSVKIGDTWYSYARIEPIATVLGIVADAVETGIDYIKTPDKDRKTEKVAVDAVLAITKNLTSKTFLEGITGLLQAVHDPDRYGGSYINSFAGLLVPGVVAQFARGTDPVQREITTFDTALANRIPGLRTGLPVKYDILGQPKENLGYGISGTLGIATKEATQTPLQKVIEDVGFTYTKPEKKIKGVELDETTYEKYSKLSGEMIRQELEQVIVDPAFNQYTKAQKNFIMKRVAERMRTAATNIIFGEKMETDTDFSNEFVRQRLKRRGEVPEEEQD
jgi:hypothetical protein